MIYHLFSITIALIIDRIIGDPHTWPHPVRWIGSIIAWQDRRLNKASHIKAKGVQLLVVTGGVALVVTFLLVWGAYQLHHVAGIAIEAIVIATTISQKNLTSAALQVYRPLKSGNEAEARQALAMIVGRDTDHLQEGEITRATVETVAENITDGITAPLFWALVGGAPLGMLYRAVNTCDSMVGYKNDRYLHFGWASARFDDVLNWLPARITGYCMLIGNRTYAPRTEKQTFSGLRKEARKHPSPNSGWGEAAAAIILGVQLGGVNHYQGVPSKRATMGQALQPLNRQHILQSIQIMKHTVFLFGLLLWIGGGCFAITSTWF